MKIEDTYFVARFEGFFALGACKTALMVGFAHCGDHLSLDILMTGAALCPVEALIVRYAVVSTVLRKESTNGQGFFTLIALEASLVEMFIGHTQHFT